MKILIDNGHGTNTRGKRSPDGRLIEALYCREIAVRVEHELCRRGYETYRLVREEDDIPLSERCRAPMTFVQNMVVRILFLSLSTVMPQEMGHNGCRHADGRHGPV